MLGLKPPPSPHCMPTCAPSICTTYLNLSPIPCSRRVSITPTSTSHALSAAAPSSAMVVMYACECIASSSPINFQKVGGQGCCMGTAPAHMPLAQLASAASTSRLRLAPCRPEVPHPSQLAGDDAHELGFVLPLLCTEPTRKMKQCPVSSSEGSDIVASVTTLHF